MTNQCKYCHKDFHTNPSRVARGMGKFCSKICYGSNKNSWNKGLSSGKSNWLRLDGTNEYRNLHKRIGRKFGQDSMCESCKTTGLTGYKIVWANISGQYLEDRNDWKRLCRKCHYALDKHNETMLELYAKIS